VSERGSVEAEKLLIVWSSADREVAREIVFVYLLSAMKQQCWDRARLVVWGPSARLLSRDEELQALLKEVLAEGVDVHASQECAERYGVADTLAELGITVQPMSEPLSEMLTLDWVTLSF
jgi:hypothetical protein